MYRTLLSVWEHITVFLRSKTVKSSIQSPVTTDLQDKQYQWSPQTKRKNEVTDICKYLSYKEATYSESALRLNIPNIPNADQILNMRYVGTEVFDPVREFVGGSLAASSFFRCKTLNKAIGGSTTSFHCFGQAIDIDADTFGNGTNSSIFLYILDNLPFTELIYEYPDQDFEAAWVHVALAHGREGEKKVKIKRKGESYKVMSEQEIAKVRSLVSSY